MNAEAEITVNGEVRKHDVRLELEVALGRPAPKVSMRRYDDTLQDAGDPANVSILRGFVQRKRSGGYVMEKPIPRPVLEKMRSDSELEGWLYENVLRGFPDA